MAYIGIWAGLYDVIFYINLGQTALWAGLPYPNPNSACLTCGLIF